MSTTRESKIFLVPQRMRYGAGAYNTNGDNVSSANSAQGADLQGTKLWWAKQ